MNQTQRVAVLIGVAIAVISLAAGFFLKMSVGVEDCGAALAPRDFSHLKAQIQEGVDGGNAEEQKYGKVPSEVSSEPFDNLLVQVQNTEAQCASDLDGRKRLIWLGVVAGVGVALAGYFGLRDKPEASLSSS